MASGEPHDDIPTSSSTPSVQVTALAGRVVERFCRPTLSRQKWIAGLDPFLSLAGADAYSTVDPSRVACTRVTGSPRAGVGDEYTRVVTVPTDVGPYRVTVTREAVSDPWLVFRVAPISAS